MHPAGLRVLVAGAGIAGLAVTRTLHDWGADVEVVERSAGPPPSGTGLYLPGNAARALRQLGVDASGAVAIRRQRTTDHRGRVLFDVDVQRWWDGVGPCLAMTRVDLVRRLLAAVADVPIRWRVALHGLHVDDDGVTACFDGGKEQRYDLLLGADGIHSTVRERLFGPVGLRPVGQHAHRFLARWPEAPAEWWVRLGRRTAFLSVPVGDGVVYCYSDGPATDAARLAERLAVFAGPVPAMLAVPERTGEQAGPIEEVRLERWSRGGALLVGDAAHATSPNMAQGVAMALEDALVLPECLAAANTVTSALRSYEQRRRPRTDWVLAQTHRRDRARGLPPLLRDPLLRRVGGRIFHANYAPLQARP